MKTAIKDFLKRNKLYYPIKYSWLFRVYQSLFRPEVRAAKKREIDFYKSFLPACRLIFDIGANDGHKTEAFLDFSQKVICCEPDEENFNLLKTRFRNQTKRVIILNKALSDQPGHHEFYVHHRGSAFNTLSQKWKQLLEADHMKKWNEEIQFTGTKEVETTTLDQLVSKYGKPDFIKIDVEGYEPWVLRGLSTRVAFISFESLLPDYFEELRICLDRIHQIDAGCVFNVAREEKLLLLSFVKREKLDDWINSNKNILSIEIIVKMTE